MGERISCSFIGPVGPTTIYTTAVVDLTLLVRVWYNMTKDTRLSVIPFAKNVSPGNGRGNNCMHRILKLLHYNL